jgi:hypothetical protein
VLWWLWRRRETTHSTQQRWDPKKVVTHSAHRAHSALLTHAHTDAGRRYAVEQLPVVGAAQALRSTDGPTRGASPCAGWSPQTCVHARSTHAIRTSTRTTVSTSMPVCTIRTGNTATKSTRDHSPLLVVSTSVSTTENGTLSPSSSEAAEVAEDFACDSERCRSPR